MKKIFKIGLKVMPIVMVLVIVAMPMVLATEITPGLPALSGDASTSASKLAGNIWKTVEVIIRIVAVAAVVIAGIRYMFASADEKADIKKQTIVLVAGAVLVFAATYILTLVQTIAGQILVK